MNIAILAGTLSSDPVAHELPSGDELVRLEVTIRSGDGPAESVPVVAFAPSAAVRALSADDEVVVSGRIRRRFFRQGGQTRSATELVAHRVVPARQRRRSASLVAEALSAVETYAEEHAP